MPLRPAVSTRPRWRRLLYAAATVAGATPSSAARARTGGSAAPGGSAPRAYARLDAGRDLGRARPGDLITYWHSLQIVLERRTARDDRHVRRSPRPTAPPRRRKRDRASYERATAYAILDEAYHCHLGFVVDGEPRVLPTLHARVDDTLYVHGSTGSGPLLAARGADGLPVCVTVTHLDGLVLARSQFHHSANYRSRGRARPGPPGHRRGREAAGADRGGGEGRRRAGRPTPGRRRRASWPRPRCWR